MKAEGLPLLSSPERPGVHLARTDRLHLHSEPLEAALQDQGFRADLIVFLSKHAAKSGRPSLTVHPVGNFTENRYGGQPGRVTPTLGDWQSHALRRLDHRRRERGYAAEVTFEVTHHGPLLSTPAFFLELGSTADQWEDPDGALVVAKAAWDLAASPPSPHPVLIGLGGGHYAPRFTEAVLTRRVDFAHMVPSHAAEAIADPAPLVAEIVRGSTHASGVYVHQGTIERPAEARWLASFEAAGLPAVESRTWAAPA